MAVSGRTQQGMYGNHACITEYVGTRSEAEKIQSEWRASGFYSRVQIYPWNNGTRKNPRIEFKIMAWKK